MSSCLCCSNPSVPTGLWSITLNTGFMSVTKKSFFDATEIFWPLISIFFWKLWLKVPFFIHSVHFNQTTMGYFWDYCSRRFQTRVVLSVSRVENSSWVWLVSSFPILVLFRIPWTPFALWTKPHWKILQKFGNLCTKRERIPCVLFPAPWESNLSDKGSGASLCGLVVALGWNRLSWSHPTVLGKILKKKVEVWICTCFFYEWWCHHLQFKLGNFISLYVLGIQLSQEAFLLSMLMKSE